MKKIDRPCMAFKLNYCDGGKDSEHVGFYGICSDNIIKYNIKVKKREWCSNPDCDCNKYFHKKISREELEENWDEEDVNLYTCYESAALRDWYFEAGYSYNGEPMHIRGAKTGHLCIFTTVEPNMPENSRMIVAMFIIGKVFEGNDEEGGYVGLGEENKYYLEFTPNEAKKMKFWNVYHNEVGKKDILWGSGLFRYFSDEDAVKFLKLAVEIKRGTDDEEFSEDFLNYYCELNSI